MKYCLSYAKWKYCLLQFYDFNIENNDLVLCEVGSPLISFNYFSSFCADLVYEYLLDIDL